MFTVSARTLNILAALVWYVGGIRLLQKGIDLLIEAESMSPGLAWPWVAGIVGLALGGLKAKYLFTNSIKKNLIRIDGLSKPKIWQIFSPGFFAALTIMILAGVTLSRMAHNNYPFLIVVAILDIGIAIALLGSSYVYWTQKAFVK
ncbi:MAG: hypothetical protein E3J69_03965 [Anaerolineales bacterium]|nr:MAG: hypothetical protein E3J69_03965 [Anaerolineales bacterium]